MVELELGQRLARAMKTRSVSIAELARAVGMSYQGIRKIVRCETQEMDASNCDKIAAHLRISSRWLSSGRGKMDLPESSSNADAAESWSTTIESATVVTAQEAQVEAYQELTIDEYDTGGKMGYGLVLKDQPGVIRRWVVSPDWVQQNVHRITSPKNLAIVTGFGDSMRPLYNPGDPLLIDRGITRVEIDGIYFFRVGEEGYVKRLQRIPTAHGVVIRAKSDNEKYDPFDITKDMDFEVFGRVVKAWRGEDF